LRMTPSHSVECRVKSARLTLSKSSPPFFSSPSWQLTQYSLTSAIAAAGAAGCCPAAKPTFESTAASTKSDRIPRRMIVAPARRGPMKIRGFTGRRASPSRAAEQGESPGADGRRNPHAGPQRKNASTFSMTYCCCSLVSSGKTGSASVSRAARSDSGKSPSRWPRSRKHSCMCRQSG
jgi:hypothetical protein